MATDLIERRKVAENSRWSIFFDEIRDGNGRHVPDYMVAVPRQIRPDLCGGVAVLAEQDGQFGLLHVYRHAIGRSGLEVVKGFLDEDEGPVDAAFRELAEEAGLTCARDDMISLGATAPEAATIGAYSYGYLARNCTSLKSPPPSDDAGPAQFRWYSLDQALDMAMVSDPSASIQIIDAMTLVCLLRAAGHMHSHQVSSRKTRQL